MKLSKAQESRMNEMRIERIQAGLFGTIITLILFALGFYFFGDIINIMVERSVEYIILYSLKLLETIKRWVQ